MYILRRVIHYTRTGRYYDRNRETLISAILAVRRRLRALRRAWEQPGAGGWGQGGSPVWDANSPEWLDYLHAAVSGLLTCGLTRKTVDELERILQSLIALDPDRPAPPVFQEK